MYKLIKSLIKKLMNGSKVTPTLIQNPTDISVSLSTEISLAKTIDSRITPVYNSERYWATFVDKSKDPNNIFEPR